jgi:hypothetical protein
MDDQKNTPTIQKEDLNKDHLGDAMQRLARASSLEEKMFERNPLEPESLRGNGVDETPITAKDTTGELGKAFEQFVHEEKDEVESAQARLEIQTSESEKPIASELNTESIEVVTAASEVVRGKEEHIAKIIEDVKSSSQTNISIDPVFVAKNNQDWLLEIPIEERPQKSLSLILNKVKTIQEVIKSFLEYEDLIGLDDLESLLAENYEQLLHLKLLPKI